MKSNSEENLRLNCKVKLKHLYNLKEDIGENHDVALQFPEIVEEIRNIMKDRSPSHIQKWNFNGNQL